MINVQRTIEVLGYHPDKVCKTAYVIRNCNECNKEQKIRKCDIKPRDICKSCSKKGERNPFKHLGYTIKGENNTNWKDGRTVNPICKYPGCNKKINKGTIGCGLGMCKKHSKLGELNGRYIDGRTPIRNIIRNSPLGKEWALSVFKRDNFTCQKCGKKNEISGKLNPHHKKHFSVILEEFLNFYSNFSPIEDKETLLRLSENWAEFWYVSNGITLCESCHLKEHLDRDEISITK